MLRGSLVEVCVASRKVTGTYFPCSVYTWLQVYQSCSTTLKCSASPNWNWWTWKCSPSIVLCPKHLCVASGSCSSSVVWSKLKSKPKAWASSPFRTAIHYTACCYRKETESPSVSLLWAQQFCPKVVLLTLKSWTAAFICHGAWCFERHCCHFFHPVLELHCDSCSLPCF